MSWASFRTAPSAATGLGATLKGTVEGFDFNADMGGAILRTSGQATTEVTPGMCK